MVVLMPNTKLAVRRRSDEEERNEHGERVLAGWMTATSYLPGRTKEGEDGRWTLAVDPSLWPVRTQDQIVSEDGQAWSIQFVHLIENNVDPLVNYVLINAVKRVAQGTEPGGGWFVARYEEVVDTPVSTPPYPPPVYDETHLWRGYGPPSDWPDLVPNPGDQYLDLLTGNVYEWET